MWLIADSDQQIEPPTLRARPSLRESWQSLQSSGTFQMIQCSTPQHSIIVSIITTRQNILLNQNLQQIKQLTTEEWKEMLQNPNSTHTVLNHIRMTYSICQGLSEQNKVLYWQNLKKQKLKKNELKSHNSFQQKYTKSIRQSIEKLRLKVGGLYGQVELNQMLEETEKILMSYYSDDPEVGFCRSMEYLAFGVVASLKQHQFVSSRLVEDSALYFSLILRKRRLRDMFFPSNPGMFNKIKQFKSEIQDELPELYHKIESIGKQWHHLFYKYFLTVLLNNVPYKALFNIVIQLLLLEGYNVIFHVLKRILYETERQLIKMSNQSLQAHLIDNIVSSYFSKCKQNEVSKCVYNIMVKIQQLIK